MHRHENLPYVKLGSSGLKVSKIILGCIGYGTPEWYSWVKNEEESIRDIKAAYDMGVNAFDTADVYSNGLSEVILGKAIRAHDIPRDAIVIMTKVLNPVTRRYSEHLHGNMRAYADEAGYVNQHGLSRKHIFDSIKQSLERLEMDYVDVLQCHGFDEKTPIPETMEALHDIVNLGYARYIGMSNCRAWEFQAMQNYAITHGLTPFISLQTNYNLLYREDEHEILPMLKRLGVSCIPWSTLARGALITPLEQQVRLPDDRIPGGRKLWHAETISRVEVVARAKEASIPKIAIAWSVHKPGVDALVISPPSPRHLAAAIDALRLKLSEGDISFLEALYEPQHPIVNFTASQSLHV